LGVARRVHVAYPQVIKLFSRNSCIYVSEYCKIVLTGTGVQVTPEEKEFGKGWVIIPFCKATSFVIEP
uniref:hypothetical protein n=1 Tax=Schleiferilactobacillus harbinensis TaxID=304207 RepID=UPI0019690238